MLTWKASKSYWTDLRPTYPKYLLLFCVRTSLPEYACIYPLLRLSVVANFVPPPHDSTLPIVKLMHHPRYQSFQTQTAALSLYADVSVKLLPPSWVSTLEGDADDAIKHKKEWKRRIKMY